MANERRYNVVKHDGIKTAKRSVVAASLPFEDARSFAIGWLKRERDNGNRADYTGVVSDRDGYFLYQLRVEPAEGC